jgi:hypothetical protein
LYRPSKLREADDKIKLREYIIEKADGQDKKRMKKEEKEAKL